jgi:mRNA-degrading endonuclease RelE of RelBE toxin-antitoxin system
MTFKVLIHPRVFDKISAQRRDQIKEALKELKDPLPGGNKKEVKGSSKIVYQLRVGDFRAVYSSYFSY